jgi:hypothetical protein
LTPLDRPDFPNKSKATCQAEIRPSSIQDPETSIPFQIVKDQTSGQRRRWPNLARAAPTSAYQLSTNPPINYKLSTINFGKKVLKT